MLLIQLSVSLHLHLVYAQHLSHSVVGLNCPGHKWWCPSTLGLERPVPDLIHFPTGSKEVHAIGFEGTFGEFFFITSWSKKLTIKTSAPDKEIIKGDFRLWNHHLWGLPVLLAILWWDETTFLYLHVILELTLTSAQWKIQGISNQVFLYPHLGIGSNDRK